MKPALERPRRRGFAGVEQGVLDRVHFPAVERARGIVVRAVGAAENIVVVRIRGRGVGEGDGHFVRGRGDVGGAEKFGAPALVPEPGSMGLLLVGGLGFLGRRRRS